MVSRYSVIARGRVQGVGFRFFVNSLAISYGLTGWVKNRYDGTVQFEVQGPESRIRTFLESVREGNRFIRVDELAEEPIPAKIGESAFRTVN